MRYHPFNKKKALFARKLDLNARNRLVKCYTWSVSLYGAETWTLRKVDQKYLGSFEMRCWRRREISWTDCVRNEVLQRVNKDRNILQTIKRRKSNWIGHILRRNCLLKQATEGKRQGKIEAKDSRGRRRKQLLDSDEQELFALMSTVAFSPPLQPTFKVCGCSCPHLSLPINLY
jgi:hypothetical protein